MFSDRTNWNLAPNRLSEAVALHRASGRPLLDLTTSNPADCGFTYDRDAILQALSNPAALAYEPDPRGLESSRRAVAAYYAASLRIQISIDDIILTTQARAKLIHSFFACSAIREMKFSSPSLAIRSSVS